MSTDQGLSPGLLREAFVALSPRTVILTAVVGLAVLFLADSLRTWYRLSHVPGPFWAGFSKAWMVRQSLKGTQPYAIQAANEKYGELHPQQLQLICETQWFNCRVARAHWPQ